MDRALRPGNAAHGAAASLRLMGLRWWLLLWQTSARSRPRRGTDRAAGAPTAVVTRVRRRHGQEERSNGQDTVLCEKAPSLLSLSAMT